MDDASNESFLNEDVAGALGLKQSYQTVKVHVLNNSVETFQAMPLTVTIESVNGQLSKEIEAKTCPRSVTGSYQVEIGGQVTLGGFTLSSLISRCQRRMHLWTC